MIITPNRVTWLRVLLVLIAAALLYSDIFLARLTSLFLMIIAISMDMADGYIARKYAATTTSGALIDIGADRIVEIVLLVVFSGLELIPVYIPIIFLTRGILTDLIRALEFRDGKTPFEKKQDNSFIYRMVVSGRTSRGLYGLVKAVTFGYIILVYSLKKSPLALPFPMLETISFWMVIFLTVYNLARGLPIIYGKRGVLFK